MAQIILIDTSDSVRDLVEFIEDAVEKPFIFVDLEGVDLSRNGLIAIMQILVPPSPVVHLVDVYTLQRQAFDIAGQRGQTLRTILESKDYPKVFFDVRNDSDALYSHFEINLHGVVDLQVIEFASRPRRGRFVKGLAKCISEDGDLNWQKSQEWLSTKEAGQSLFAPEKGGRYEVFLERPLSPALQKYCAQDVLVMPKLLSVYGGRLKPHLALQINGEVLARVVLSQSSNFNGKRRHMAIGPSFTWFGSCNESKMEFPMSLICSDQLKARCSLNAVATPNTRELVIDQISSQRPSEVAEREPTVEQPVTGDITNALEAMELRDAKG